MYYKNINIYCDTLNIILSYNTDDFEIFKKLLDYSKIALHFI